MPSCLSKGKKTLKEAGTARITIRCRFMTEWIALVLVTLTIISPGTAQANRVRKDRSFAVHASVESTSPLGTPLTTGLPSTSNFPDNLFPCLTNLSARRSTSVTPLPRFKR
ncbi:hypothetical protein M407DRAFT_148491 [Tulasnella calospora MUT 4182]|uniref:Uncharacterized protein n=1 Tax=Tulasnella calospora MUT 4182 TaxID=1051891 RepID=A0A0C3PWF8_9AGAM|nr:hypothetical protein M407DRAFT_148491 [Tulasnella calospora MUT 4182]